MRFNIDGRQIGGGSTFIIAEIGNNHNGDLDRAKRLIDDAIFAGADCVKFQMRHLDQVYTQKALKKDGADLGTEYVLDLLERFELDVQQHFELFQYCRSKGVTYMCTPWDETSVDVLEDFGVSAYKVASADLTNVNLINRLITTGKPLILSTGMSTEMEILKTAQHLKEKQCEFCFLHCNSTYPAPVQDINLSWMSRLKQIHPLVGYSGHERGIVISLAAVALGAKVLERHFTHDRLMEGPDHSASLEPEAFRSLVDGVREIEMALGEAGERKLSQGEMINRENLAKSLVATRDLTSGEVIHSSDVAVRSPGQGLSPQRLEDLLGKTLTRNVPKDDFFFETDITATKLVARDYDFGRPWGVPVRYHDYRDYLTYPGLSLVEFHLSYSDLDVALHDFFDKELPCDFIVHAPELFQGSHLLDLATPDAKYRQTSIDALQKVIDITRALKKYFPSTDAPKIVTNIGGFSMDKPLKPHLKQNYYDTFLDSLSRLDRDGVEIIPQTMAPFPWHFGGQRYQNIFVDIDEFETLLLQNNLRVCLDVSHTFLASNHFDWDFYGVCSRIAPYCAHLHIGDSSGLNGEGLQIGEGDIDFNRLGAIFAAKCPETSFIPEIWQGHKNDGEGFLIALERLEGLL